MRTNIIFIICLNFCLLSCNLNSKTERQTIKTNREVFGKGTALANYYSFNNIESVELKNWSGIHYLNAKEIQILKADLETFYCDGQYSKTKPNHFWCVITFKNNSKLYFYNNSNSDIIISKNLKDYTFKSRCDKKIDFEKY